MSRSNGVLRVAHATTNIRILDFMADEMAKKHSFLVKINGQWVGFNEVKISEDALPDIVGAYQAKKREEEEKQ